MNHMENTRATQSKRQKLHDKKQRRKIDTKDKQNKQKINKHK